jgi:putative glutamine amidotransferase
MKQPLIGITTSAWDDPIARELAKLAQDAALGVERAGGVPVLVPIGLDDRTLLALSTRLDGVVLMGGGDVNGARYGATHPRINGVDDVRDRYEIALARTAASTGQPLLGICRGAQIFNVALGGTLQPHVPDMTDQRHDWYPDIPDDYLAHPVRIEEDSRLARIIGKPIVNVNSLHHQAVLKPGEGLQAVAHSPDNVIEAIELTAHPFAIGVQWHPEALHATQPEALAIFKALVDAARG